VPATHGVQAAAPLADQVPAGHAMHAEPALAPALAEKVPAAHGVHTDELVPGKVADQEPAAHLWHAVPATQSGPTQTG